MRLTCPRKLKAGSLFWVKLVPENVPQVLARTYSYEDGDTRITAKEEHEIFALYIIKVKLSDTAVYYCMKTSQQNLTFLKGTYLKVEGKYSKASINSRTYNFQT